MGVCYLTIRPLLQYNLLLLTLFQYNREIVFGNNNRKNICKNFGYKQRLKIVSIKTKKCY